jgi:hypothetical protein
MGMGGCLEDAGDGEAEAEEREGHRAEREGRHVAQHLPFPAMPLLRRRSTGARARHRKKHYMKGRSMSGMKHPARSDRVMLEIRVL